MLQNFECPQCHESIKKSHEAIKSLSSCPSCETDFENSEKLIGVGSEIGPYNLVKYIGKDPKGCQLFEAKQLSDTYLLKLFPEGEKVRSVSLKAFQREIEVAKSLNHSCFHDVMDHGEDEGVLYLVTDYRPGIVLEQFLKESGAMSELEVLQIALPLAEALKIAWDELQVIHCELSPKKIILCDDNTISISNMGLAKIYSPNSISLDEIMNPVTKASPQYMSPEQIRKDLLDCRSDIYTFGLLLYEMLTGKPAIQGSNENEISDKQLNDHPLMLNKVNDNITLSCATFVDELMAKDIEERLQTWGVVIEDIKRLINNVQHASKQDDDPSKSQSLSVEKGKLAPGSIIGNGYEIDRKVESNNMGDIYIAYQEEEERLVKIKVLPQHMTQDKENVARFLRDIEFMSTLKHSNLLSVIEGGEDFGRYYMVTEYEEGLTIFDFIGRYGSMSEKDALHYIKQIADVLEYAWESKKILHREVKPQKILINEETKVAKITDFGIAKSLEDQGPELTEAGFTIGTPDYMSPEQISDDENLDFRSDIYALGLVLRYCLTGKKAFDTEDIIEMMNKQLYENPIDIREINPSLSDRSAELVSKMIAKSNSDRHESWASLKAEISQVEKNLNNTEVSKSQKDSSPLSLNDDKKNKTIYLLLGIIIFLLIACLLALILN